MIYVYTIPLIICMVFGICVALFGNMEETEFGVTAMVLSLMPAVNIVIALIIVLTFITVGLLKVVLILKEKVRKNG